MKLKLESEFVVVMDNRKLRVGYHKGRKTRQKDWGNIELLNGQAGSRVISVAVGHTDGEDRQYCPCVS